MQIGVDCTLEMRQSGWAHFAGELDYEDSGCLKLRFHWTTCKKNISCEVGFECH